MGFFKSLKKGLKKVRKGLGLPAITIGNVAKVAGATAIGGPLAGAGAVLKSKLKSAAVGGAKQVLKTKAEKVLAEKVAKLGPRISALGAKASQAVARPGGAPVVAAARAARTRRATHSRRKVRVGAAQRGREKLRKKAVLPAGLDPSWYPKTKTKSKRKPPTGGLDLKGLSASWKAAGKPGTWQGWIQSHK